jgi:hypothetical protein
MATSNAFSDYAENAVLNHVFGATAFVQPVRYLGLFTAAPTDAAGSGTEILTGSWYVRKIITFDPAVNGTVSNSATIDYGQVTGSAVTITNWAIFDAVTGGNMIAYGDFGGGQTASPGNNVVIKNNTISFTLN